MEEQVKRPTAVERIEKEIAMRKAYIHDQQDRIDRLEKARLLILSNPTVEEVIHLLDGLISEDIAAAFMAQQQAADNTAQG